MITNNALIKNLKVSGDSEELRILLIAPACYPVFGAEQIVNIKMLQAFSKDNSIHVDLVSKKRKWQNYPNTPIEELGINLDSLHIVEVDNKVNLRTIFQNFMTFLCFGIAFKGCHWAYQALPVVKQLLRHNHYDYVLTKDSPSFLLGHYIKRKYHIPWIASWNDPAPECKYPYPYGKGRDYAGTVIDKKIIQIMCQADFHIFPCLRLQKYMQSYMTIPDAQCTVIPHLVIQQERTQAQNVSPTLRLIHSGFLGTERNPFMLLKGLRTFIDACPSANISFTYLGVHSDILEQQIHQFALEKYVTQHPPVCYADSLKMLNQYDVAVIIEADCEEGIFLPTKVSDFMQCQIPILSISPENGTLHDLYERHNIPYFAPITNSELVAKELEKLYNDFTAHAIKGNAIDSSYLPEYAVSIYKNLKHLK